LKNITRPRIEISLATNILDIGFDGREPNSEGMGLDFAALLSTRKVEENAVE
jgi:hypothetical protein